MKEIKLSDHSRDLVYLIFYYDVFIQQLSKKASTGLKRLIVIYIVFFIVDLFLQGTLVGSIGKLMFYVMSAFFIVAGFDIFRRRFSPYFKNKNLIHFYQKGVNFVYDQDTFKLDSTDQEFKYTWNRVSKVYIKYPKSLIIEMMDKSTIYVPTENEDDINTLCLFIKKKNITIVPNDRAANWS